MYLVKQIEHGQNTHLKGGHVVVVLQEVAGALIQKVSRAAANGAVDGARARGSRDVLQSQRNAAAAADCRVDVRHVRRDAVILDKRGRLVRRRRAVDQAVLEVDLGGDVAADVEARRLEDAVADRTRCNVVPRDEAQNGLAARVHHEGGVDIVDAAVLAERQRARDALERLGLGVADDEGVRRLGVGRVGRERLADDAGAGLDLVHVGRGNAALLVGRLGVARLAALDGRDPAARRRPDGGRIRIVLGARDVLGRRREEAAQPLDGVKAPAGKDVGAVLPEQLDGVLLKRLEAGDLAGVALAVEAKAEADLVAALPETAVHPRGAVLLGRVLAVLWDPLGHRLLLDDQAANHKGVRPVRSLKEVGCTFA